jgi:pimeloyl-ACP methyl ester carboxylesterase
VGAVLWLVAVVLMISITEPSMASESEPETSVCGFVREPLAFWLFRRAAGTPDAQRVAGIQETERIWLKTRDARTLGGYKLSTHGNPQGYLLVAQGNAMLADQIIGELQLFRDQGFDVYVYDYRGYGLSEGKSRLTAIISDYREIVAHLNAQPYHRHALYGMSMGGIILLNAVGESGDYSSLVIDSSPSRISPLGCPEDYDPVNHLPVDSSRIKIISGERDRVVWPEEMEELMMTARSRGAKVVSRLDYAHPFQDVAPEIHRQRMREVAEFLLSQK